jgi:hypothetical protein
MPYPDLPPNETFWRCPACGEERQFRASGIGHVVCSACSQSWSVEQLKKAHAEAHATTPGAAP